jgi:hypothetical protein
MNVNVRTGYAIAVAEEHPIHTVSPEGQYGGEGNLNSRKHN